jgi:FlaA1/EpsC-like NDP-sugar epimerase
MSIPEAVYLILRAAVQGEGGETFVFQMGEAINIYELAKTLVLSAGLLPEKDLPIHFVGLSDGEKMEEELWEDWEHAVPTIRKEILVIKDQNPLSFGILDSIQTLEEFVMRGDRIGLVSYLNDLMPGFAARRHPALQESAEVAVPVLEAA